MASFNVTWNSGEKAVGGKIFARKRKSVNSHKSNVKSDSQNAIVKEKNKTVNSSLIINKKQKPIVDKIEASASSELNKPTVAKPKNKFIPKKITNLSKSAEESEESSPKWIKRKKKKDKLIIKQALQEGTDVSSQNSENSQWKHSLFSVGYKDVHIKPNLRGKSVVEKVFSVGKTFSNLEIHKYIVSNLEKIGFTTLTNVQEKSIPVVLSGKNVLVRSQTGSGKTLAYAVPILNALQNINPRIQRNDGVQVIILVPTRELVLQTYDLFGKINTFQWIVVGQLCGGENRNTEKSRLRKGVHILIATPGRLLDHLLHTTSFKTTTVKCLVLDEADRLLDMGFKKDIVRIVEELERSRTNAQYDPMALLRGRKINFTNEDTDKTIDETDSSTNTMSLSVPSSKFRQTILLSATLSKDIAELADFTMKDHIYIDALEDASDLSSDFMVIPNTVKQKFMITHVKHRLFTLSAILVAQAKKCSKTFVFMGSSAMVDYHYELFTRFLAKMPINRGKLKHSNLVILEGIEEDSDDEEEVVLDVEFFKLHGSMDQNNRKDVFKRFLAAKSGILLCTDVVSRGIDVPTADCIIQYNGPQSIEAYLHRVGRTGRAGKCGTSYIFLTHEEQDFVTTLETHKVYLQKQDPEEFLQDLCDLMQENDEQKAALALQRHYENSIANDKELHKLGCIAYSSWSRFYNTYSNKMRPIFDFKNVNLGHYVTSFGLRETPTEVARIVKGQVGKTEKPKFNKKLAIHVEEQPSKPTPKRKVKSLSLTTSEYSSGLEPKKKKKKKNITDE